MSQEFDLGCIRGAAGPAGPAGPQGPAGPVGATPSISIGQVVTVAAGEEPYVTRRAGSGDEQPVLDFGLPGADGAMTAAVYDSRGRHQDVFAYCDALAGRRTATVVVAAADSRDRARADLVCGGEHDQLTVAQAIAALPVGGGRVVLLEGSYILSRYGVEAGTNGSFSLLPVTRDNVSLTGQGPATVLKLADGAAGYNSVFLIDVQAGGFCAADLTLDGNASRNEAEITGLRVGQDQSDARLERLQVRDCSGVGLQSYGSDALLDACLCRDCGCGVKLSGRARVRSCRLRDNGRGLYIYGGQQLIEGCAVSGSGSCGIYADGGSFCLIRANTLWGQPVGVSLTDMSDAVVSGNLIFRDDAGGSWGSDEYPLLVTACARPHLVGNYLRGKAASLSSCEGAVLYYGGTDWNPTA